MRPTGRWPCTPVECAPSMMTNTRIGHVLAAARAQALRDGRQAIPERLASWKPLPLLLLLLARPSSPSATTGGLLPPGASRLREGRCGQPSNSSETVFLHLDPVRVGDLPAGSQEYGFANLDFLPAERWQDIDGHCIIGVQLPAYDIASIRTGQYDASGQLWSTEIRIAEPE